MEKQSRRRSRFAVLLVRERKDGTIRQSHIATLTIMITSVILLSAMAFLIVRVVNEQNSETHRKIEEHEGIVTELNDELTNLERANSEMYSMIDILSETLAIRVALDEIREEELRESSLPTGFPIGGSGSASLDANAEETHILVINASDGNTIISVGAGVVESIEPDETYGNRLVIDHRNGFKSIYHNSGQPLVRVGEELGKRYILFLVGNSNRTLGFGIMEDEQPVNPMDIMETSG
ncbi:MAG: M23 family metallopeptidase [Lachnospiraceae bacterium]|jgi:septal ring factor EnvC (AmiA/AmiB activator)|nr:M23 family metallopeptidase [Lachnospiraceae bacterium]